MSDDYTLKVNGGLFIDNSAPVDAATIDVQGGTLHCHRCHFTANDGTAIQAAGEASLVGLSFSKFANNTAFDGLVRAAHSRGGFASTSFIDNAVSSPDGAVVALRDNSLFLGRHALFRGNVGGDLLAQDSHFRVDKTLFEGSALTIPLAPAEERRRGSRRLQEEEQVGVEEEEEAIDDDVEVDDDATLAGELGPLMGGQEGSAVRLYGASSLRGFNNYFDGNQGPAILALDASNVTLGRPCFTNDADSDGGEARFVEAAAEDGDLTLWGACAFPSTAANDVSS